MISIHVRFEVEKNSIEQARKLISEFLYEIQRNESGTIEYRSFFFQSWPHRFFHIITFENDRAEKIHRNADYTKKFIDELYKIVTAGPELKFIKEIP